MSIKVSNQEIINSLKAIFEMHKNGRITIKAGYPLFSTIIVDCDVVVYLDISNELLVEHCKKRGNDFTDAKNVKEAVEEDWNSHREKGGKTFYYLVLVE